jgi:hypothetical protein
MLLSLAPPEEGLDALRDKDAILFGSTDDTDIPDLRTRNVSSTFHIDLARP